MKIEVSHGSSVAPPLTGRFHQTTARLSLRGARAAYVGPGLDLAPHRNAVAVVAAALEDPFELALSSERDPLGPYVLTHAALIPPGVTHHLKAHGPMCFLYLDVLSDDYRGLNATGVTALHLPDAAAATIDDLCAALGLPARAPADPRIASMMRAIDAEPNAFTSFAEAARYAGLSPSRCSELLRRTAGVPFRRYRLWRRMAHVLRSLAKAHSLTEAAHAAGFSSSAHFSAAFKTMFGLSASALISPGIVLDLDC